MRIITLEEHLTTPSIVNALAVQGQARVFEATLQVVLKDAKGAKLAEKTVTASMGAPEWGDYSTTLPFSVTARTEATLEAFALSPKDGTPQYTVSVPVVLLPN